MSERGPGPGQGFTVWFTGLSGAGKSSIANETASRLRQRGLPVVVLDGDEVRQHLSFDLGFSRADRDLQVARVGWLCQLLTESGVVAIAALVSPFRDARDGVRARVPDRFVEVYVEASLETLRARDTKDLYRRSERGEVSALTGVTDPYEPPLEPDVHCVSDGREDAGRLADRVVARLDALGYLVTPRQRPVGDGVSEDRGYTASEEAEVEDRLTELGYR